MIQCYDICECYGIMTSMIRHVDNLFELGHAIRASRQSRGITQAALAGKAGVSRAFVSSLERGMKPRAELIRVMQVLQALDLQIALESSKRMTFSEALEDLLRSSQT